MKAVPTIISAIFLFSLLGLLASCNTDPIAEAYVANCGACHGKKGQGTGQGPSLVGRSLTHGESIDEMTSAIANGFPQKGMPPFSKTLEPELVKKLAIYVAEIRKDPSFHDYKIDKKLNIPKESISSELHDFKLELVAKDLNRWPYSIAPLPDGRILLVEKTQGLSIISKDGKQSELISGMPKVYDDFYDHGIITGSGWMLDVALHPDYENNGWIYIAYEDRCSDCNELSRTYKTDAYMVELIRGRIKDGQWVDQESIWKVDKELFSVTPSSTVGGRVCFDEKGHVFFSVGSIGWSPIPAGNIEGYLGIQDLTMPYGKIYRVFDDGRIPEDNPFASSKDTLAAIWTYGHRSPQGLEVDPNTGLLWGTEMGPRGGDEVNLLLPGRNYGWPLVSKGFNYNGSTVEFAKYLDIEFDPEDLEEPKVDLTPSPAISSFIFYTGDKFPKWKGQMIMGTLKAASLYRMKVENEKVVEQELLIENLARIRDIEMAPDGNIYLLLEHKSGAQIFRMKPGE